MKQSLKNNLPLFVSIVMGIVTAVLRTGLYAAGLDEKNLLREGHPLEILIWVAAAVTLGLLMVLVLQRKGSNRWEDNFQPSLLRAAGSLALAAGIVVSALAHWNDGRTSSDLIRNGLEVLSAAGMILVALCAAGVRKTFFLCHALV